MPEIVHGDKPLPRNGGGTYSLPATYLAVTGETIEAQQHNDPLEDLQQDMNTSRPILYGGTGQSTAVGAHDAFSTKGSNVASATTTDIGAASGAFVHITGTTTITGFGTKTAGVKRILVFDGALTLTHNATSLILPGGANITTAAGDAAIMVSEGSGNWKCVAYIKADGTAVALPESPTFTKTDDGATGVQITTQHISASPAASDVIADWIAQGKDSGGNTDTYGDIQHIVTDPTAASEDSVWAFLTRVDGTLAERLRIGGGIYMEGATGGDPGAGKINATEVQANGAVLGLTSGTPQASTSGTSINFTSIPAWVKRITIMFSGVSTSGTSEPLIQIGDAGGIETTGYVSTSAQVVGSTGFSNANSTSGFILRSNLAANTISGAVILSLLDASTNTWVASGTLKNNSTTTLYTSGDKSLSATLDRVRVTTDGGTDTFDAGKINILYE